ncbi:MAG: class I SAM-dependent methyltransferase [Candidatus Eisenbacteria bacterium]
MSFYSEFAGYYDAVFPFDEETYSFLRSRFPSSATRVLDVGCGTGDYCGRLASQGYETLGVDLDQWMIERAKKTYPASKFRVLGMEDIGSLKGLFGAAYCIGNVASHLATHRLSDFLWALRERLTQDATWVVQTVNWDFVLNQGSYTFEDVPVQGTGLVFERSYPEISEEKVLFRTRLSDGERSVFEGEATLFPVRGEGYVQAHREAGFELIAHKGSFVGAEFDPGTMSSSVLVFRRT